MKNRWVVKETDAKLDLMSEVLGISKVTARVMANRGLRSKNTALAFLKTSIDNMRPFVQMKDAEKALQRVKKAIESGEKITIYGDYDVDGMTSTAILQKTLLSLGADSTYYIPHRITEGYGLNKNAISSLAESGTKLLFCVDNGISSVEEVCYANTLGLDTVILDHHEPGEALPNAAAIVDPKQEDCPYVFKEFCAGGLAYKFAAAMFEFMDKPFYYRDEFLVLAALATICDIVALQDENRVLVNCGLIILNANKKINCGLSSLLTLQKYLDKPITTSSAGFILGPCLNAAGRLDSGSLGVELLLAQESKKSLDIAEKLIELNKSRKALTEEGFDRMLSSLPEVLDKVLVLVDTETHESLAGIVAGRIREATGHPTIVLTPGESGMKGSGRSNASYNMYAALERNKHLLTRFGGHFKAAGLSLPEENIPLLREALNAECTLENEDFVPVIEADGELSAGDLTVKQATELIRLAPFGSGNPEPVFITRGLYVKNVKIMDEKNTLIFSFVTREGTRVKGIAFGLNARYKEEVEYASDFYMDIAYNLEVNEFRGAVEVQARILDFVLLDESLRFGL